MVEIRYRRATTEDVEGVAALFRRTRETSLPYLPRIHSPAEDLEFFRSRVFTEDAVWVAERSTHLVGFCAFGSGWLNHLYVDPPYQGCGIGTALVRIALEKNANLHVWVFQENMQARAFYEAKGFALVKETDGSGNEERLPDALYRFNVVSVPVIETPRLRLRGHRYSDLLPCVAMWSDPNVTKFISGRASTQQQTWSRLLTYIGHWALLGFGYWVIEDKASTEFVGEVGFADFQREIAPSMRDRPELGFALASRFHAKGYATESVRAVLSWSDKHLSYPNTVCLINPENLASLRVVQKCGYKLFERGLYNEQPTLFLSRDRVRADRR
jgi:RimJ/RimL family protein N-acetyltransferase